ncbi:hypothetical protein VTL71DRAFT_13282 [Oculimacula yallundae]|uniref:Ankyrin n=1 Tax=Oculimacula yallundae TaxID=86028 RepID=A0ABR4CJW2_9HELO
MPPSTHNEFGKPMDLNTALDYALLPDGDDRAVAPLLSHGAKITIGAFSTAALRDNTFALQAFHDHGWDVNSTEFGEPMIAVNSEAQVQWLLKNGADPNIRNNKGVSPLVTACLQSSTKILELLVSHGAKLEPSALFTAMSPRGGGGLPIMTFLVDHGVDVNAKQKLWG